MRTARPAAPHLAASLTLLIGLLSAGGAQAASASFGPGAALGGDDDDRPRQSQSRPAASQNSGPQHPQGGARPAPTRPHGNQRPTASAPVQSLRPASSHASGPQPQRGQRAERQEQYKDERRRSERNEHNRGEPRRNERHERPPLRTSAPARSPNSATFGPGEALRPSHSAPARSTYHERRPHYSPPRHSESHRSERHRHFPTGRRFHTLPHNHHRVWAGRSPYYYHDGIFFRLLNGLYIVVRAPIGAVVTTLPSGYGRVVIGGTVYFTDDDAYYRWDDHQGGYVVVDPVEYAAPLSAQPLPAPAFQQRDYYPGEVVDTLPAGSNSVTIDTIQYFQYGNTYFRSIIVGGQVRYVVSTPN